MKWLLQKFKNLSFNEKGNILLVVMVFGAISFGLVVTGIAGYSISENRASKYLSNREQAFQIAEAGVEYYRWHLAHYKNDYQDGTATSGPYIHDYANKDGEIIGKYSLNIIPPPAGSTIVTVESTGWLNKQTASKRTIRVKFGFPAYTDYAYLTNASVVITTGTIINGKLHSNGGVQFDGTATAQISSALKTYKCKKKNNLGCSDKTSKAGVWGLGGPSNFFTYPVPSIDIKAVIPKASDIQKGARTSGLYLNSSGKQGYRLQFLENGTINVYKVLSTKCSKGKGQADDKKEAWFCTDRNLLSAATNYPIPANGFIYVHDRVWVDGTVEGRATIVNKKNKDILLGSNIVYAQKDGTDALGLIAGRDIVITKDAPENMEIDAVLLSMKGNAKRHHYKNNTKTNLLIYGSVITMKSWYWNWIDSKGKKDSGYVTANLTYDANLTYGPPPGFPFGADYNLISWEEVKQ